MKQYWKWKSTIIDFDNIKEEKADFGDYWTKKEMIFHYLGCPDDKIHEWYNGGWSCEYNYSLSYAKEYGLVEDYIDYDDLLFEKDKQLEAYENMRKELINFIEEHKIKDYYGMEFINTDVNNFLNILNKVGEDNENR